MAINKERLNQMLEELHEQPLANDEVYHAATKLTTDCPQCIAQTVMNDHKKPTFCDTHIALQAYLIGRKMEREKWISGK